MEESILLLEAQLAPELRAMIDERADMVYQALRTRPNPLKKQYDDLINLCAEKRPYIVPPEYSGILDVVNVHQWSPTDSEVARVLVSILRVNEENRNMEQADPVPYADIVNRLDEILPMRKTHIYRSMRRICKPDIITSKLISGFRLR